MRIQQASSCSQIPNPLPQPRRPGASPASPRDPSHPACSLWPLRVAPVHPLHPLCGRSGGCRLSRRNPRPGGRAGVPAQPTLQGQWGTRLREMRGKKVNTPEQEEAACGGGQGWEE